jgi:3-hydroxyisobutyrate dehydrogenase-like beta-hydroxyacid dehydrogenase
MSTPTCGVLGAGTMGSGFAVRLLEHGHTVIVHDIDPGRAQALVERGARAVESPRELAASCDQVVVALPDTPHILAAWEGEDGLQAGLGHGALVLIASTVSPETPRELARRVASLGVELLDTPVSGGPVAAHAGTLAIMAGGSEEAFARARPLLEVLGATITLGIAEGLALAAKAGADLERVCAAIAGGSGGSWILREWMPRTVLGGSTEPHFALELMCKDMELVRRFAEELDVPLAAGRLARDTFTRAAEAGHGGADFSIIAELAAREAGTTVAGRLSHRQNGVTWEP